VHFLRIAHRDEVEAPITDWLREAYDVNVAPTLQSEPKRANPKQRKSVEERTASASRRKVERPK
jgi:hypothetical protein